MLYRSMQVETGRHVSVSAGAVRNRGKIARNAVDKNKKDEIKNFSLPWIGKWIKLNGYSNADRVILK